MKRHWPEYLTEAGGLGLFLVSASSFAVLLFHPASPVLATVPGVLARNALMGLAMASTSALLVHSRWGKQSGAHFNPAVTLTFYGLGKVARGDALAYVAAHFLGGIAGISLSAAVLDRWIGHPEVNYVVTRPGPWGVESAWIAEFGMSFVLMTVVLAVSGTPRLARYTGLGAAFCIFVFVTFEAPLSGTSLNPARSLASALVAHDGTGLWIYFTAPPLGMLAAARGFVRLRGRGAVACAKLHHQNGWRCIFCEHRATTPDDSPEARASGAPHPHPGHDAGSTFRRVGRASDPGAGRSPSLAKPVEDDLRLPT